jgi:hypothetical protein
MNVLAVWKAPMVRLRQAAARAPAEGCRVGDR